jgi:hypothetical protein
MRLFEQQSPAPPASTRPVLDPLARADGAEQAEGLSSESGTATDPLAPLSLGSDGGGNVTIDLAPVTSELSSIRTWLETEATQVAVRHGQLVDAIEITYWLLGVLVSIAVYDVVRRWIGGRDGRIS